MKYSMLFILFCCLSFIGCDDSPQSIKSANAIYLDPGPCCSNFELLNGETVSSSIVGYDESILAAVNIQDFDELNLKHGDLVSIDYKISNENYSCADLYICNRQNGIPIEL